MTSLTDEEFRTVLVGLDKLEEDGPALVDTIAGSRHANMKELRSVGGQLRALFAFDPKRQAIILLGGRQAQQLARLVRAEHPAGRRPLRRLPRLSHGADMKTKTLAEIRATRPHITQESIDAERELVDVEVALHTLREELGVTQTAMAERLKLSRPRVHTIERAGEDLRLSTVERYVEALGGRLELRVHIEGRDPVTIDRS